MGRVQAKSPIPERTMPHYQLVEVDNAGDRNGEIFTAPNDEEAVRRAISVTEAPAIEVWRGGLKIQSLNLISA